MDVDGASFTAHVERCERTTGPTHLTLSGLIWDGGGFQPNGVHFEQPVTMLFDANLDLDVRGFYSSTSQLVTLWATPQSSVRASLRVIGPVDVQPTSGLTQALNSLKPLEQEVRSSVARDGAELFRTTLANGASVVFDVVTLHPDFVIGLQTPGTRPDKAVVGAGPSLMNEHLSLQGAGFIVRGPFAPQANIRMFVNLEYGTLSAALICRDEFLGLANVTTQGHRALASALEVATAGKPVVSAQPPGAELRLVPPPCEWLAAVWSQTKQPVKGALMIPAPGGQW